MGPLRQELLLLLLLLEDLARFSARVSVQYEVSQGLHPTYALAVWAIECIHYCSAFQGVSVFFLTQNIRGPACVVHLGWVGFNLVCCSTILKPTHVHDTTPLSLVSCQEARSRAEKLSSLALSAVHHRLKSPLSAPPSLAAMPSSESESFPPFADLRPLLRFRDLARPRDVADVEGESAAATNGGMNDSITRELGGAAGAGRGEPPSKRPSVRRVNRVSFKLRCGEVQCSQTVNGALLSTSTGKSRPQNVGFSQCQGSAFRAVEASSVVPHSSEIYQ